MDLLGIVGASDDFHGLLAGLLDTRPFPSLLLDAKARIVVANARAREHFGIGSAAQATAAVFKLPTSGEATKILDVLDALQSGKVAEDRCVLPLETDPDSWLVVERVGTGGGAFLASVRRLEDLLPKSVTALGAHLKVTPSEAALLRALISADSVTEYAAASDRQPSTVRWHVRNMLSKTGSRSQRELVNLALLLTM